MNRPPTTPGEKLSWLFLWIVSALTCNQTWLELQRDVLLILLKAICLAICARMHVSLWIRPSISCSHFSERPQTNHRPCRSFQTFVLSGLSDGSRPHPPPPSDSPFPSQRRDDKSSLLSPVPRHAAARMIYESGWRLNKRPQRDRHRGGELYSAENAEQENFLMPSLFCNF